MTNKGFWWAFGIAFVMFLADIGSTLMNGDLSGVLEANPLHRYGGFLSIIALNLAFLGGTALFYHKSSNPFMRFVLVWGLVMVSVTRIIVVYNNYQVFLNPPTMEQALAITQAQKVAYQVRTTTLLNLLPMLNSFFTYFFWSKDHDVEVKQ